MSVFNELDPNKDSQNNYSHNLSSVVSKCSKMFIPTLFNKYKDLHNPNFGQVEGVKVYLTRKPDVATNFFKARPVPCALRKTVERGSLRLVEKGILEPVKTAEFAAFIVLVLHQDGQITI